MTDQWKAILTAKSDEWGAFCREWVKQQSDEATGGYMKQLIDGTDESNPENHRITCHLALFGFVRSLLSVETCDTEGH